MRDVGFNATKPQIERISFRRSGYMTVGMADGRLIYVPLSRFPGIEKLTAAERRRYHIADGEVILFHDDDEVYHIQDFLGTYETNAYSSSGKQSNQKSKTEEFLKSKGYNIAKQVEDKEDVKIKTTFA